MDELTELMRDLSLSTFDVIYAHLSDKVLRRQIQIRPGPAKMSTLEAFEKCRIVPNSTRRWIHLNCAALVNEIKSLKTFRRRSFVRYKRITCLMKKRCLKRLNKRWTKTSNEDGVTRYFKPVFEMIDYILSRRTIFPFHVRDLIMKVEQLKSM